MSRPEPRVRGRWIHGPTVVCGLLDAFIFGVQARSPVVLASAGGTLLLLAVIATLPPALRKGVSTRGEASRDIFAGSGDPLPGMHH
jgi:hypothetical protein